MNLPGLAHSRPAENRAHPGLTRVPILTGLSFSTKLILLVVVPLVLTLVVTLPLTVTDLNRLASEISAERLDGAVRIIDQQFEDLEESLNNMADEIARNPRLLAAVRETDVPVIVSNLLSTRIRLGIQHLEVVDLNGVRLGHDHQPGTNYDWEAINLLNTQGLSEIATITMVPSSQGWWLTAVRPLKDSEGLIGAVTVGKEIDAGALAEVIFGESAPLIRVLNEDGEVVSASYSNIDQSRSIPITLDPALVEVALSGRKVVGSATIDGTEKRTAYSPFVLGSGYRGVFAVALTTSPVVGLRDQIIAKHVLVTAALALVVLGVGYMVIRTITRRILLLRDGAVEIANGNLSVRIEETVNDEMGALAHEFNRMADSLNEKNTQLEQANRNLEMRVFERTEALEQTNAQLLEAQSQLVRTEKLAAIGAMSAGVAHDLRNPLGAIRNGIYFLKSKLVKSDRLTTDPKVAEFLDVMDERITQCDKIIGDLISFTRIPSPTYSVVALGDALENALRGIEVADGILVVEDYADDLVEVQADPNQLVRVFTNLIINAQEAMLDGGRLTIGVETVGPWVEVTFRDTGTGMSPEELEKIFDPLYSTKMQGTGLGLAVCQQIIGKHDGTLDVASKEGVGTTVTVRLPLRNEGR